MKHTAVLMISVLVVSGVRADWLNITYEVAVSKSSDGPFASSVMLWSQPVPPGAAEFPGAPGFVPSSIDLVAYPSPHSSSSLSDGNLNLQLATFYATQGNDGGMAGEGAQAPFFIQIKLRDKTILIAAEMTGPSRVNPLTFTTGPFTMTAGERRFQVSLYDIPVDSPYIPNPGETTWTNALYDVYATIPLDELTDAPEPSALVLAGMAAAAFALTAWWHKTRRRRRPSPIMPGLV